MNPLLRRSLPLLAIALPLAACQIGGDEKGRALDANGSGTSRTYPATEFADVALRGSDDVDVRVGGGFSVRAEGPSDELDKLRIALDGDTLVIGRKRNALSWGDKQKVKVFVTLPRLAQGVVLGSGDMAIDRVDGAKFEGVVAGSGTLSLAALAVDEAELSIAGSGDAQVAGTARMLKINVAGSGNLRGTGLRSESAEVAVAGSGDVSAQVNGNAKVSILGSGDVNLGPQAKCTVSKMGSGKVSCAQ